MARHKNKSWNIPDEPNYEQATLAVLMDIRDELQESNRLAQQTVNLLNCWRVSRMLNTIERMDKRIAKKLPLKSKKQVKK